ncbi:MAG: hypothetical protein MRZ79_21945 [Bacteroidia bacterium]|nr:hypothetical protein [Bacteroidia bacterium]
MRSLIFIGLVLITAINPLSASVDPQLSALYFPANEQAVVLNINSQMGRVESLVISEGNGDHIYSDEIGKNKNRIKYDLNQLPDGAYTIRLIGENSIEVHEIDISKGIVRLARTESFKRPLIRTINERLIIQSRSSVKENIRLSIYNESGKMIYEFDGENSGNNYRAFNLENLLAGKYSLLVRTQHFVEELQITR